MAAPTDHVSLARRHAALDQLEEVLGHSERVAAEGRLHDIALSLAPTFRALPKNEHGGLSIASTRHTLHRLFVKRHGWHVKGLAPDGQLFPSSKLRLGLDGILPARLVVLLDEQLASDGFDFHEIVLIAAAVETFIHADFVGNLRAVYNLLGLDVAAVLEETRAIYLLEVFMEAHIAGLNVSDLSREDLEYMHENVDLNYPSWQRVSELISDVRKEFMPDPGVYAFSDIASILESLSERFGGLVDQVDCHELEHLLLDIEEVNGAGRVKLRDFYKEHVENGTWQFQERIEYLRLLGVLDEYDPSDVRLLIPNYLHMQANCLNVSTLYDLCCIDTCGDLLSHLEKELQAPYATPGNIIRALSEVASAHVPANRTWGRALVRKLEEVADHHEGQVPLHGRLFAQWMHFAYPRECMYPHLSGTTVYWTDDKWLEETGLNHWLTADEMIKYIESVPSSTSMEAPACNEEEHEEELCYGSMWVPEEELVDPVNGCIVSPTAAAVPAQATMDHPQMRSQIRFFCIFLAFLAVCVGTLQGSLRQAVSSLNCAHGGSDRETSSSKARGVFVFV